MEKLIHSSEYELLMQRLDSQTTLINAQFSAVNSQFDGIIKRFDTLNGKVGRHDQKIIDLDKADSDHINKCPNLEKIRKVEDALLTQRSILDNSKFSFSKSAQIFVLIIMLLSLTTSITLGVINLKKNDKVIENTK